MTTNHRQHTRAPLSGVVKFYEWNRPLEAEAGEISAGGMFLRTEECLPEGAMLTVRVTLPGLSRAFTVLARVMRTVKGGMLRRAGMGVHFVDISPQDRRLIDQYVSARTLKAA